MRRSITPVTGLLLAFTVAGCSAGGTDDAGGGGLRVVATTTQVGSIAEEVGGDAIELTVLLHPGVEAHDYEMTPADAAAVEDAALILRSGAGLETWLDDALTTIGTDAAIVDLSEGVTLREVGEGEPGDEGDQHVDPHYWLSGPNAIQMVRNATAALDEASRLGRGRVRRARREPHRPAGGCGRRDPGLGGGDSRGPSRDRDEP